MHDRGGYFVRLDPTVVRARASEATSGRARRRRLRFSVRPLPVLLMVIVGWTGWAATTEGGVSARANDIVDSIRDLLADATTDPGLKRGAVYFNDRFAREGAYPRLSSGELQGEPETAWSLGVEVLWCSPRAIVLQGLTGSGTISRLLLDGRDLGDVAGEHRCPADLTAPAPWELPDAGGEG